MTEGPTPRDPRNEPTREPLGGPDAPVDQPPPDHRPADTTPGGGRGAAARRAHPARQGAHASARSAGRVGSAPRSWSSSCRLAQLTRTGEPIYTHPNRWSWNAQLAAASTPATQ